MLIYRSYYTHIAKNQYYTLCGPMLRPPEKGSLEDVTCPNCIKIRELITESGIDDLLIAADYFEEIGRELDAKYLRTIHNAWRGNEKM